MGASDTYTFFTSNRGKSRTKQTEKTNGSYMLLLKSGRPALQKTEGRLIPKIS